MENYEGILHRRSCLHSTSIPAEPSLRPRGSEEVVVQLRCDLGRPCLKAVAERAGDSERGI